MGWTAAQTAQLQGLMTLPAWAYYFTSPNVPAESRIDREAFPYPPTDRAAELLAADLLEIACMYARAQAEADKVANVIEIKAGPLGLKKTAKTGSGEAVFGAAWCERAARLRDGAAPGVRRARPILAAGYSGANPVPVFTVDKTPDGLGLSEWDRRIGLAAWLSARHAADS